MWNGNSWKTKRFLNKRCSNITNNKNNNLVDNCSTDAQHDIVGNNGNKSTGKGKVPVVPYINICSLGCIGQKHNDINHESKRDNNCPYN